MRLPASACSILLFSLTHLPLLALEGQLTPAMRGKVTGGNWNIEYFNVPIETVIGKLNEMAVVPVTLDAGLAKKQIASYSVAGRSFLDCVEALAKVAEAKVTVAGEKLHLVPGGVKPAGPAGPGPANPPAPQAPAPSAPEGGADPRNFKPPASYTPGSNATWSWSATSLENCRSIRKPVLLYVYDKSAKASNFLGAYCEIALFPDAGVREAVKNFSLVMIDTQSKAWHAAFTGPAKGGSALYLLIFDGSIRHAWDARSGAPAAKDFVLQAKKVAEESAALAARLAQAEAAQRKREEPPEERKQPGAGPAIPGLGDEGQEKKTEPKKKEPKMGDEE